MRAGGHSQNADRKQEKNGSCCLFIRPSICVEDRFGTRPATAADAGGVMMLLVLLPTTKAVAPCPWLLSSSGLILRGETWVP